MRSKTEAVIFDADGTVLDTRELAYAAYEHVLSTHGYAMPHKDDMARFGGRPSHEFYAHFAARHDRHDLHGKHKQFQEEHLDLFAAYEGLDGLVAELKKRGLRVGLCTNRSANIGVLLEHLGIKEHFDAVVHAEHVSNWKPHPEGLLKICEQLGVQPEHAAMIGDTESDIDAAKAAGFALAIGVTHGVRSREFLEKIGADYVVDHLNDILPLVI